VKARLTARPRRLAFNVIFDPATKAALEKILKKELANEALD